jgi:hypothetical protein
MKKVAIIIPVYKSAPDEFEKISLQQCNAVLKKYSTIIVAPDALDCNLYLQILTKAKIKYFQKSFFENLKTYNRLMLSGDFYKSFSEYDYILIYQPDAFVFRDELNDWCKKGYDYIGAPWFKNFNENKITSEEPWGVGNGGFSLRKTRSFIDILADDKIVNNKKEIIEKYLSYGIKDKATKFTETILKLSGINNRSKEFIENFPVNEDYFWGHYANKINKNFSVASIDEAMKFAFECSPAKLYEINNNTLPFGCHAWWKYDLEFWKPFINNYGYTL